MSRLLFAIAGTAFLFSLALAAHPQSQDARPPARSSDAGKAFVGADTCATCHQNMHDTWQGGRHSKMLQPATTHSVIGDFSRESVTLHGDLYRFQVEDGRFFVTDSYVSGTEQKHRVDYTLGSRRIQHYITTLDNGQMVVLPPSWDVQRREWFHNMEIVRPDEDDQQRVQQWNRSCVGCHVSQETVNYDVATRRYDTRWQDFGTSCERCHGPGQAHVDRYRLSAESRPVSERLIVRPTRLDPAASSMICAQCHSLYTQVAPDFKAGDDYYDHFEPVLEYGTAFDKDPTYWADGRPRRFSNDAIGLWESECFLRGGATCTSCHNNPHEPDVDRNPQLAPANNALCTQCHDDIGKNLTTHTRHKAASTGSSCVECHMPKAVVSIRGTMRDHTMSLPTPENTVAFGIPNACTSCHADREASWAVDAMDKWWPANRRAKMTTRARAFTAARSKRPEALGRLIALSRDDRQGPLIQANAVGYLRDYQVPDAAAAVLAAARSKDPIIRGVAVATLSRFDGPDGVRSALLAALDDRERTVRIAAMLSLANSPQAQSSLGDEPRFRSVSREDAAAAALHADDARAQRDLGFLQLLTGEFDLAATALVNSFGLEPERPTTRYLLGLARLGQGRRPEALELLRSVPRTDPAYGNAHDRLLQLAPASQR